MPLSTSCIMVRVPRVLLPCFISLQKKKEKAVRKRKRRRGGEAKQREKVVSSYFLLLRTHLRITCTISVVLQIQTLLVGNMSTNFHTHTINL